MVRHNEVASLYVTSVPSSKTHSRCSERTHFVWSMSTVEVSGCHCGQHVALLYLYHFLQTVSRCM